MTDVEFQVYLTERRAQVDAALAACLPSECHEPKTVHAAMRYAISGGGKRLRPILSLAVGDLMGVLPERAMPGACAVELVHTASLILDDLPCMDNAPDRRGKPCVHIAFGEATALLSVMGLVALAFDLAARAGEPGVSRVLAHAMGTSGLVAGQQADLALTGQGMPIDAIEQMHSRKSGALFVAAVSAPAILAHADESDTEAVCAYARNLGLAFQITDDLLDAGAGYEDAGKNTFVSQLGAGGARNRVGELTVAATAALERWGVRAEPLRMMAGYVGARSR